MSDCNKTRNQNYLVPKWKLNHSAKLAKWLDLLWVLLCTVRLTVCCFYGKYSFQSESTLYRCLKMKKLYSRNRRQIWSLSDCKWTQTHNHLVHKRILSRLATLVKLLSCIMNTFLYVAFDCMFLSCHAHLSDCIYTLQLPECQSNPCTKQAQNLNRSAYLTW